MFLKKYRTVVLPAVVVLAVVTLSILPAGCGGQDTSGRLKVSASIVPLADFCSRVGGEHVEVQCLVPPGAGCGHTFEPTPGSMDFLSKAGVFVENGLGLESWATDVLSKITRPDVVRVVAAEAVPADLLLPSVEGEPGLEDPHVWLDPSLAVYQVEAIREGLVEADPSNAEVYQRNAAAYIEELKGLDGELRRELEQVKGASFISTHPTWTYFAPHFGLVQVGEVEELPGKEPSARRIAELMEKVKEFDVKAVFAEPQLSPRALEIITKDAGPGVKVATVDPVGDPDNPEVSDYIKMMRFDVGVMSEALE
ncbi:MAG: metal ABC transporter substrate-binding protein [Actinobacteria bacterium]|nr:metal ABC transporter substrate-binding protein [Actinomycetota bacterium]MBU1943268.1 metal ABC transporter substrate-binding protein [Actinomycetota bacterium]MBU2688983.1 metal ABC transporter substrate-binding protein [Actinomycetota bacterium]